MFHAYLTRSIVDHFSSGSHGIWLLYVQSSCQNIYHVLWMANHIDPCVIYYLAFFFRPEELALRVALFYSFGQISGFVGGFLGFAVSFADGRIHAWRWLFLIGMVDYIHTHLQPRIPTLSYYLL
jgi:hypothetical protein